MVLDQGTHVKAK